MEGTVAWQMASSWSTLQAEINEHMSPIRQETPDTVALDSDATALEGNMTEAACQTALAEMAAVVTCLEMEAYQAIATESAGINKPELLVESFTPSGNDTEAARRLNLRVKKR